MPEDKILIMIDCIFCLIANGKVSSEILHKDEELIAFRDINPQTPTHLIIIPRRHIPSLTHLSRIKPPLIENMVTVANQLAEGEGISKRGFRLVINCGKEGGQLVPHLHMHLLGGRKLSDELG